MNPSILFSGMAAIIYVVSMINKWQQTASMAHRSPVNWALKISAHLMRLGVIVMMLSEFIINYFVCCRFALDSACGDVPVTRDLVNGSPIDVTPRKS